MAKGLITESAPFVAAEAVEAGSDVMLRGTVVGQTESTVFVQWRPGFPPEPCHRYGRSAPRYLTAADLAAEALSVLDDEDRAAPSSSLLRS